MRASLVLRWLFSRSVRNAIELRRYIARRLGAARDRLAPDKVAEIERALDDVRRISDPPADPAMLSAAVARLKEVADTQLPSPPLAGLRDNLELALVTAILVLAFETFFLQLMKIPSASAQPTLFGTIFVDLKHDPAYRNFVLPGFCGRVVDQCLFGISYYDITAECDGELKTVEAPRQVLPFVTRQRFLVGDRWHTVWFPPENLVFFAGFRNQNRGATRRPFFHRGDCILKIMVRSGDRLLADRFTYNFVRPKRGEMIVFAGDGIPQLEGGTYYIKRLVALGGEHVRIGNDRHLVINGLRLDAATPHFENVYTFYGRPPRESQYSGHVNEAVARRYGLAPGLAPLFLDGDHEFVVRPHHYLVLGDNTLNSHDSRAWGDFPEKNVVGRYFFVYWPLSSRFGWGVR